MNIRNWSEKKTQKGYIHNDIKPLDDIEKFLIQDIFTK